jgi:hypothetical protein
MATSTTANSPGGKEGPGTQTLVCPGCGSADDLLIEAIGAISPAESGRVCVEYSCSACGSFYAHAASVQQVAELLNAGATAPGVLQFGRYFIHCGEPMEDIAAGVSHLGPPAGSQGSASAAISIGTRQLRCRCGFQLDAPL